MYKNNNNNQQPNIQKNMIEKNEWARRKATKSMWGRKPAKMKLNEREKGI